VLVLVIKIQVQKMFAFSKMGSPKV